MSARLERGENPAKRSGAVGSRLLLLIQRLVSPRSSLVAINVSNMAA